MVFSAGECFRNGLNCYLTAAIQNIKIVLKHIKEPAAGMEMQVAIKVSDQASRTKPYRLINLFDPQWSTIVAFGRPFEEDFALPSY